MASDGMAISMGHKQGQLDSHPRLPTRSDEAVVFRAMRFSIIRTLIRQRISSARLRMTIVLLLTFMFWGGLFWLFFEGFYFLRTSLDQWFDYEYTVHMAFSVFFGSLMVMLVFSAGIILYSGIYASDEMRFLLALPASADRLIQFKVQEAVALSSWGFLLLGSPMLIAYGAVSDATWYYYAMLLPFMISFAWIPSSIGSLLCLAIVDRLPRFKLHILGLAVIAAVCALAWLSYSLLSRPTQDLLTPSWIQDIFQRLRFSEHRFLPSWWLSSGILQAAHAQEIGVASNEWADSFMFLAVLISNALVLHQLVIWTGGRVLRRSYAGFHAYARRSRGIKLGLLDRAFSLFVGWLPKSMQLLLLKDFRVFRRDPAQWLQFLIFFGLLLLYFLNIRRFQYSQEHLLWIHMVSFLNLAVVGLILATFTTRFIFPMISLESRRLWILGRLPIDRKNILWGKFLFAAVGSIIPCVVLITLSDYMLGIQLLVGVIHQFICLLLCLGLAGISVGLGARLPDLRQTSPSKIAAGFGGTLNLVLSTLYITVVVAMTAIPCHFYLAQQELKWSIQTPWLSPIEWMGLGTTLALVSCIFAIWLPMRSGIRAFRNLEY